MHVNRSSRFAVRALLLGLALSGCAMFGGNSAEEGKPQAAPPAPLHSVWSADVDQRRPMSPYSYSTPAVAGKLIVIGGQDSYAHIFNLQGSEVRRVLLQAPSASGAVALSDHLVVLGDAQGILYGIDPLKGSIVWHWQMPTVMLGHPVRIGDDVLVQTGDNSVYRVTPKGEKLWSFSGTQAGLSMNITPSPLVAGDTCYAVMTNGDAVALRSDNGDLIWRHQLILDNDAVVLSELKTPLADPVLVGDVLVTAFYQGDVVALSAKDGEQLWQRNFSLKSAPAVHQGRLFIATAGHAVLELDAQSGATLWKRQLDAGELTGPVVSAGKLYVADDHGRVFTLSFNGRVSGELSLPGRIDRAPVASNGGVLLRNNLGGLYLIR